MIPVKVKLSVQDDSAIKMKAKDNDLRFGMRMTLPIQKISGTPYEGSYEVTPSGETQVLQTDMLYMTGNITINPIPSNYGLITWNGSNLMVS